MRALFVCILFPSLVGTQDDVEALVKQLAAPDFAKQGLAARELEQIGPKALPALKKAVEGDNADLRAWASRIIERIEGQEKKFRALIEKLGSADDEEKEKAEGDLLKAGVPAIPYVQEAAKSENKNLRRRAEKLLGELESVAEVKPDTLDFVTDKPFKGKGTYDFIDSGAGGSGRFGSRLGGKRNLVARGGGGADTEDGVLASLKWLSRHQSDDGSWRVKGYTDQCNKVAKYAGTVKCAPNPGHDDFAAGVTGLATLAFLGAGYSHLSKDTYDGIRLGDTVRKALQWMMLNQDPEGCIGPRNAQKYMYNHAICALALSEAYGLTGSNLFKEPAQKAIDFVIAAQNPGKAWRYSFKCGDNDTSVTSWCVTALKSAEISGLSFPRKAYDGARAWFDEVTDENFSRAGYTFKGTGKVYVPGMNENFDHHETLTAVAVAGRIFMDKNKADPRLAAGCDLLLRDKPRWDGNSIDFYYWFYASLALYQFDGPAGHKWKAWNEDLKNALVKNQNTSKEGCKSGSWEPVDRWSGEGGRVYGTAINALSLEVYYRYASAFGHK